MEIPNLFIYIAKVSACFILMFGFYLILLAKQNRPTLNRMVLILSVLLSLLMPALSFSYTINEVRVLPSQIEQSHNLHESSVVPNYEQSADILVQEQSVSPFLQGKLSGTSILLCIYFTVSGLLLARFVWHVAKFCFDIKKHGRAEIVNGHSIWVSDRWNHTFSFFKLIVFTEKDFANLNRDMLLEHELVHVRQLHSFDLLLAELFIMFCWFNPLVYAYRRSLSEVHEYLADGRVVDRGGDSLVYKQLILDCVSSAAVPRVANTFSAKLLKNRFEMIAKTNKSRSILRYTLLLPITIMLLALFSFKIDRKVEYRVVESEIAEDKVEVESLDKNSSELNVSERSVDPIKTEPQVLTASDSIVLYKRLDSAIDEGSEILISAFQKPEEKLFLGNLILGNNTPFTLLGTAFGDEMPNFVLSSKSNEYEVKPVETKVTGDMVKNVYLIKEEGEYNLRVSNSHKFSQMLYYITLPKDADGKVDFGLKVLEKTVFLKKKDSSTKVSMNLSLRKSDDDDEPEVISEPDSTKPVREVAGKQPDAPSKPNWRTIAMRNDKEGEPGFFEISIRYDDLGEVPENHQVNVESNLMRILEDEVDEILRYFNENIAYPSSYKPKRRNLDVVEVEFNLSETAEISDVRVVKGINPEVDAELVRVVSQMPGWMPEKPYNKPVPVTITLSFCLPRK